MKCTTHNQKIEKGYKKINLTTKIQFMSPKIICIKNFKQQKQPYKTLIEFNQPIDKTR